MIDFCVKFIEILEDFVIIQEYIRILDIHNFLPKSLSRNLSTCRVPTEMSFFFWLEIIFVLNREKAAIIIIKQLRMR